MRDKGQILGGDDKVEGKNCFDVLFTEKEARGPHLTVFPFDTRISASTDQTPPAGFKVTAKMLLVSRCASLSFCELLLRLNSVFIKSLRQK